MIIQGLAFQLSPLTIINPNRKATLEKACEQALSCSSVASVVSTATQEPEAPV